MDKSVYKLKAQFIAFLGTPRFQSEHLSPHSIATPSITGYGSEGHFDTKVMQKHFNIMLHYVLS